MSEQFILQAETRTLFLKDIKQKRRDGLAPAVLYGFKQETIPVFVSSVDFVKLYNEAGTSTIIDVKVDGGDSVKAIIGEVQVHPVTSRLQHIDLKRVDMTSTLEASVELSFVGESIAVKGMGGSLTIQLHEIDVECLPSALVSELIVDISVLKTFDDVIRVRDLSVPAGITILQDQNAMVAMIQAPRSEDELKNLNQAVTEDVSTVAKQEKVKKEEEPESK